MSGATDKALDCAERNGAHTRWSGRAEDGLEVLLWCDKPVIEFELGGTDASRMASRLNSRDELLSACQLALSIIEGFEPENGGIASNSELATIRAAIAKAEGSANA